MRMRASGYVEGWAADQEITIVGRAAIFKVSFKNTG
jgi:hypothetical protein